MRKTLILIITVLSLTIFFQTKASSADEINLCLNDAEQYAVIVNGKEDCLEDESWMKIDGGKSLASMKEYTPLLEVAPNQECSTEGVIRTIGFDQNNNGSLEQSEIASSRSNCKLEISGE